MQSPPPQVVGKYIRLRKHEQSNPPGLDTDNGPAHSPLHSNKGTGIEYKGAVTEIHEASRACTNTLCTPGITSHW